MTDTKHTPGPWENGGQSDIIFQPVTVGAEKWWGIYKGKSLIALAKSPEDARLIAAAPEMLEAGRDLHAALFNLRKAYAGVQEHYGFKAEQSPHVEAADAALKEWVAAIAEAEGGAL